MSINIIVWLCCIVGFTTLALAMERHARQLLANGLSPVRRLTLRISGWLLLSSALLLAARQWHYDVGMVVWVGWLAVAGLVLVFTLPRFSRESERKPHKKQRKTHVAADIAVVVTASTTPPPAHRAVTALLVIAPLVFFSWQLFTAPPAPLKRADALQGSIGPWSFVLAERDQKTPHIEAMNTPIKEFVIRFCEACDDEINMAYLKIRQPRSLRASGNGFEGTRDRTAAIVIPPAATVQDGLWLTVQGKNGEVHHLQLDIERVSPVTAQFIRERS
ncbi:MAG: DUF3325 domain-containing protein [Steroidobacteraceae bacterium]